MYKLYMISMRLQRVLSGGRITLPLEFRKKYGIKEGDYVGVDIEDGVLIVAVNVDVRPRRRRV